MSSVHPNLGKITENDFKESNSVSIAKKIIEEDKTIKTYFNEMDKRSNLDGSLSILSNGYEQAIIDIQIKTLPADYICKNDSERYFYDCDTKVFNVVRLNITLNPVVLILVDIKNEKLFTLLITRQFVEGLNIGIHQKKRVFFDDDDIFSSIIFIQKIRDYIKILNSDTEMIVHVEEIRREINRKRKLHHKNESLDYYRLIFERDNIRGFLSNFIWDSEKSISICLLCMYDISTGLSEYIQLHKEKSFIYLNRSFQRTAATDSDIVNILYEIAYLTNKQIIFKSAGVPVYLIDRTSFIGDIWRLRAEKVEKDW